MNYNNKKFSEYSLDIQSSIPEAKFLLHKNQIFNFLVILDSDHYVGVISKEDLDQANEDSTLIEITHLFKRIYLKEDFTLFDWLKIRSVLKSSYVPLVAKNNMIFCGIIDAEYVLKTFQNTGLNVEGSTVLVIRKSSDAFSYSEVFQIAEANSTKIFGSYINYSDKEETEIILNIYHTGLNEILQSFRRYGYEIISYHEEDLHQETLKTNSEYFSKYLTV